MNAPWRHHSVAQFQLRHFADADHLLWHFDKRRPEKGIGHDGPKGIFYEEHQYSTVDTRTGELDPSLEHFFDRDVENPAAPIVEKIVNAARARKLPALTTDERTTWDRFVYYQNKRVPEVMEKYVADFDGSLQKTLAEFETRHRPLTDEEKVRLSDPIVLKRIKRNARVTTQGLPPTEEIVEVMANRGIGIAVISDPKKAFIIGSHPLVRLTSPGKTHLGHPEVELWLPIASDVIVSPWGLPGSEKLVALADHRQIRRLNELIFQQSNVIAGRSKAQIESLINRR